MSTIGYWICVPFAWLVRAFYSLTGSYGVALILFTLVIKVVLLPFQLKSKKSMLRMSRLNGQMQEIRTRYANNQQKMNEEIQKLYTEEGVNPMSGCLWSFLPLPILIALYSIIRQPITHFMMLSKDVVQELVTLVQGMGADLSKIVMFKDGAAVMNDGVYQMAAYGQINLVKAVQSLGIGAEKLPQGWIDVNYNFLGIDLTATPWESVKAFVFSWPVIGLILIPILAGASQVILSKVTMKSQPSGAGSSGAMLMWTMPLMSVYIAFIMPAALGVYWIAQSVFSLVQEVVLNKTLSQKLTEEEEAQFEARQAERRRRMEEGRRQQEELKRQQQEKKSLREKQRAAQEAKAAKAAKAATSTTEAGRVGDRPYARGRAYKADRYDEKEE